MKTSLSEFNDSTLYPNLFDRLPEILPEFDFKRKGPNWVSGNKLKVTGESGDKLGAVYVYRDRPYLLNDFTRGPLAITKYLQDQGKASDWIGAIKYLASGLRLDLPDSELSNEDKERYNREDKKLKLFEIVSGAFQLTLTSEHGKIAHDYLSDRGFPLIKGKLDELHAEIGFLLSSQELHDYLKDLGYSDEEISSFLPNGMSQRIAITFRDQLGRIKGFAFRSLKEEDTPKYLYSKGLEKSSLLFNLKALRGDKDLIIVEGLLDALHAYTLGLENVVALGGTSFNVDQLNLIKKYGASKITLALDNDPAGNEATIRASRLISENFPEISLYIAQLPKGIKDPDELMSKEGLSKFQAVIKEARSYLGFQVDSFIDSKTWDTTDKNKDELLMGYRKLSTHVKSGTDKDFLINSFMAKVDTYGITRKTLEEELDRAVSEELNSKADNHNKEAFKKAHSLAEAGKYDEAHRLISNTSKHSNTLLQARGFDDLLKPMTREALSEGLRNKPESIKSGYKINGEDLLIPSGGISILTAPTSHGKTTFLINMALNVSRIENTKPIHFFSYEESKEAIILKALNTSCGVTLSKNNKRSIEAYLKTDSEEYFSHEYKSSIGLFKEKKKDFFDSILSTRKINFHYVNYSVEELIQAIHFLKEKEGVGAVFIDYMQLLRLRNSKASSRQEELKEVCLQLLNCSVSTGIPLIIGAQFNRTVTTIDKIHATAIGEAGDIERIANLIIGFWNKTFVELEKDTKPTQEILIKILKGRDIGAGAEELLDFDGNTGKIANKIATVIKDGF